MIKSVSPKAEETRRRIFDAAFSLFQKQGFDETTMREVATEAGVATGAAYYYFRSKEDLVMEFYRRTSDEMRELLPPRLAATRDLRRRLECVIVLKLDQFRDHRRFLVALFRSAVDPDSPLSPFGAETASLREEGMAWFQQALDGASTSVSKDLLPHMPRLLWLYQMGVILFWIYDRSPEQERTRRLVSATTDMIVKLLRLATLPFMSPVRRSIVRLLSELQEADPERAAAPLRKEGKN